MEGTHRLWQRTTYYTDTTAQAVMRAMVQVISVRNRSVLANAAAAFSHLSQVLPDAAKCTP